MRDRSDGAVVALAPAARPAAAPGRPPAAASAVGEQRGAGAARVITASQDASLCCSHRASQGRQCFYPLTRLVNPVTPSSADEHRLGLAGSGWGISRRAQRRGWLCPLCNLECFLYLAAAFCPEWLSQQLYLPKQRVERSVTAFSCGQTGLGCGPGAIGAHHSIPRPR